MSHHHLIRFGAFGHIGRFHSPDAVRYPRDISVVCRTSRGLEAGRVLTRCGDSEAATDGPVLRRMTVEDELLLARLERHRAEAFQACRDVLARRGLPDLLVDVEALLDGQNLLFYFLGPITAEVESITDELAETFDAKAQLRRFAQTLTDGCGPDCGTGEGGGCGTSGCSTCAVAKACGARPRVAG